MTYSRTEASRLLRSIEAAKLHPAASAPQHRAPGGQRHYGFAISVDAGRPRYVRMNDIGEWSWTADRHEAELFPSEERAEAWAARNIGGGKPVVVEVTL